MNLKNNLSKFQAKADEGIFLGYSHNSVAYRVLNKQTRKVEETFNITFDDYYIKQSDKHFENNPILQENHTESESIQSLDIDYDLIFGNSDSAANAEINAPDNHVTEVSKLTNDSTSFPQELGESMHNDPVEGEHLDSNTLMEGEHSFEGENERANDDVEGE